jgi:hypothetical protein
VNSQWKKWGKYSFWPVSSCPLTSPGVTTQVWKAQGGGDSLPGTEGPQGHATHLSVGIAGCVRGEIILVCAGWAHFAGGRSFF